MKQLNRARLGYFRIVSPKCVDYTSDILLNVKNCEEVFFDGWRERDGAGYAALCDRILSGGCYSVTLVSLIHISTDTEVLLEFFDLCRDFFVQVDVIEDEGKKPFELLNNYVRAFATDVRQKLASRRQSLRNDEVPYRAPFGMTIKNHQIIPDMSVCFTEGAPQGGTSGGRVYRRYDIARYLIETFVECKSFRATLTKMKAKFGKTIGINTVDGLSKWISNPALRGYLVFGRFNANFHSQRDEWDYRGQLFEPIMDMSEWSVISAYFAQIQDFGNAVTHWGEKPIFIYDQLLNYEQPDKLKLVLTSYGKYHYRFGKFKFKETHITKAVIECLIKNSAAIAYQFSQHSPNEEFDFISYDELKKILANKEFWEWLFFDLPRPKLRDVLNKFFDSIIISSSGEFSPIFLFNLSSLI